MLVRRDEGRVFATGRYLGRRRAGQRSAAAVVDGRGRAFEGLHETDRGVALIEEGCMVTGAAWPIFAEFWGHGHAWDICTTPGSDIAHQAPSRRGVVSGAVGVGAAPLSWNARRIQAKILEISGHIGRLVTPRNVRV
jgi:hypothetical protein